MVTAASTPQQGNPLNPRDYFLNLQRHVLATAFVATSDLAYQEINVTRCYISGVLHLKNGFQLHVAEFTVVTSSVTRLKYRYHLQRANGEIVARWDNAPHHPLVTTFPDHKHTGDGQVLPSPKMSLQDVLAEIPGLL